MDYCPLAVDPDVYEVLVENDRVRVVEFKGDPGGALPMHSHPDSVLHALSGTAIVESSREGESPRAEVPAGATFFAPATTHSVENVGTEKVHFIRVELK